MISYGWSQPVKLKKISDQVDDIIPKENKLYQTTPIPSTPQLPLNLVYPNLNLWI